MGHAIFEQRSGILGVAVVAPCGVISPEQLVKLGELSRKLPVHGMKLTTRQTLVFLINKDDLDQFSREIEQAGLRIGVFGNIVRNVKGCSGSDSLCKRSQGNAFALGGRIQEKFMNQPTPKDFKISTAGCIRGCTDPYCADFGVVAAGVDTFNVYVGGRGGSKAPRHGQCIIENISSDQVLVALEFVLNKYRELGKPDERLCRVIDRCGFSEFVPPAALLGENEQAEMDDFSAFLEGK